MEFLSEKLAYLAKFYADDKGIISRLDFDPRFGMDTYGIENYGMDPDDYRDKLRGKREIHEVHDRQNWKLQREHAGRLREYAAIDAAEAAKAKKAQEAADAHDKQEAFMQTTETRAQAMRNYTTLQAKVRQAERRRDHDIAELPYAVDREVHAYAQQRLAKAQKLHKQTWKKLQAKLQKDVAKKQNNLNKLLSTMSAKEASAAKATSAKEVDKIVKHNEHILEAQKEKQEQYDALKVQTKRKAVEEIMQSKQSQAVANLEYLREYLVAAEAQARELGCRMPALPSAPPSEAATSTAPPSEAFSMSPTLLASLPTPPTSQPTTAPPSDSAASSAPPGSSTQRARKSKEKAVGQFEVAIPMTGHAVEVKPLEVVGGLACIAGKALFLGGALLAGGAGTTLKRRYDEEDEQPAMPGAF